jgi:AcrR family transcriptional regulator
MTLQQYETGTGTPVQPLRRAPMQRRSVERVQRMLDAAQQLVAEVGYDALTTTLIAERADVSIGSLYQFFPDKQAVVRAVALRNLERFTERLTDLATGSQLTTWWELTNAVLDEYVAMHHDVPGFQTIRFGDVADLHLLDPVRDNDSVVAERFVKLIRPTVDVAEDVDLELDMVIAVKIADVLTRYAFERDTAGDPVVLEEAKRLVRAHLARRFGEPTPTA